MQTYGPRYFGDVSPEIITFRPLNGLPKRAVIDANVLLDAFLMKDSVGLKVLRALRHQKCHFITSPRAFSEAFDTIMKFSPKKGGLCQLITSGADAFDITAAISDSKIDNVNKQDNHIASLAVEYGAFVLTEDVPLLGQLNAAAIHARSLREVAYALGDTETQRFLSVNGVSFGADGHVFIRAAAFKKAIETPRRWFLLELNRVGAVCWNSKTVALELWVDGTLHKSTEFAIDADEPFSLLINYSVGRDTRVSIKARTLHGVDAIISVTVPALTKAPKDSDLVLLNRQARDLGWLGTMSYSTFGPYQVSPKVWSVCASLVGVTPGTLTVDLTLCAVTLSDVRFRTRFGQRKLAARLAGRDDVLQLFEMGRPGRFPGRRVQERAEAERWFE